MPKRVPTEAEKIELAARYRKIMSSAKAAAEADPTHPSRWYWGLSSAPPTPESPTSPTEEIDPILKG